MAQQSVQTASASLGTPTQRYESAGNITYILGALLLEGIGIYFLYDIFSADPSRPSTSGFNTVVGLVSLIVIGLGFYLLFTWWQQRGISVQVYSDGLARIQGTKSEEVRWEDIHAVWQSITRHYRNGAYTGTSYLYTLQTADNRKLKFGNEIIGIEQLGRTIQNESTKRLFPKMTAAYNAGQPVAFGPFSLSKEGVAHKNKYLSWAEIEGAKINNGYISFKKQGNWFNWANVRVSQIPNLVVFLSLIDHVVGLKAGR